MTLKDHFRPPITETNRWRNFLGRWAYAMCDRLNVITRRRYVTEGDVYRSRYVGAEVARSYRSKKYVMPPASLSFPIVFPDVCEVQIFDLDDSRKLVGVIEIVSPSNKSRPAHRAAFAAKCMAYLQTGLGLIVVDIVTRRKANLHNTLMTKLGQRSPFSFAKPAPATYAVAYRPVRRSKQNLVDLWPHELSVGGPLPTLPFALRGGPVVPCELELTYAEACQAVRIE